jgi:hypothetical protein
VAVEPEGARAYARAVALTRFLADLWRSARRPPVLRRCATIAAVVGTLLTVVNLGDVVLAGYADWRLGVKVVFNYVLPFVVSNLGAVSSLPRS